MKFDSKVKGGLAWAGLFVILAVPSADLLFGKDSPPAANLAVTSDSAQVKAPVPATKPTLKTDPIETASVTTPVANSDDPVDTYLSKGKKLPAYISDADTAPAVKPAVPVTVKPPVEVASIAPVQEMPPVPLPRDARPSTKVASVANTEQPLIIDETENQATLPNGAVEPFPLSDGGNENDQAIVTSDELEEWDSGSLADYLESRGLLSEDNAQPGDSQVVYNNGPNRQRRPLRDFFLF
jgi:hypothetical protein